MRLMYLPLIAAVSVSAGPASTGSAPVPAPIVSQVDEAECADRIETVRSTLGQPRLDAQSEPLEPLFIAAVDKRIDGCAVLQMKGNVNDLRPIPQLRDTPPRLQPAR